MTGESHTTTDHDEIRKWIEDRNGSPAVVKATEPGPGVGLLRIKFQDSAFDRLDDITWDDFFKQFEDSELAFLYQDKTKDGKQSRFFKFVKR